MATMLEFTTPLIHTIENDSTCCDGIVSLLNENQIQLERFSSLDDYRKTTKTLDFKHPDIVIIELPLTPGDKQPDIFKEFGIGKGTEIPVIALSHNDDINTRLTAYRSGVNYFFCTPVDRKRLLELLWNLTQLPNKIPYRVLLLDDVDVQLELVSQMLSSVGIEVKAINDPMAVLSAIDEFQPDVAVFDMYMPGVSGTELAAIMRADDKAFQIPIIFVSSESDTLQQLVALDLGGDDFLVKPINRDHLIALVSARAKRSRHNRSLHNRLQTTIYEREREHLALDQHAIVSIADASGNISYVNDKFCEISGFEREELIGRNHNIVKSDKHDEEFFENLWDTISHGKVWQGEICNRTKDGKLYWVESTITPFVDAHGIPYQYVSIRTDITRVKEAEQKLQAKVAQMEATVTSAPIVLWSTDTKGIFTLSEGLALQSLQLKPGEVVGSSLFEVYKDYPEITLACKQALLGNDVSHDVEISGKFFEAYYRPYYNEHGDITGTIGVAVDLTERKQSERELESNKERLRRGQVFANIGTWDWNIQTGELFWSERIAPLFGYEVGELKTSYENFLEAIHPDDRPLVVEAVDNCVSHGAPYEIEHRVVWPDGTVRWLLERGAVVHDGEGNPLQMLGVVQDVHERKMTQMALQESQEKLARLYQLSPLGIALAAMDGSFIEFNESFRRITGYPREELMSLDYWTLTPKDFQEQEKIHLQELENVGRYGPFEKMYRRKDGTLVPVRLNGVLVQDKHGVSQIWSIVEDITDSKEAEANLRETKEAAERANQAKSEFLSSMSHELRTPMNAILGFGQLMEYDEQLSEDHREYVHEILTAGNHLLELINEVLDLSKVESGYIDLTIEAVEMDKINVECIKLMNGLASKNDIQIIHKGLRGSHVRADRTRLKQAIINLISNAIKYNRRGGNVTIDVQQPDEDLLHICVSDTGLGIGEEQMSQLFQPFNRLGAENTEVEGTGIGLTLTKRIVEMMGGNLYASSQLDKGSQFIIELPVVSISKPTKKPTKRLSGNGNIELPTEDQQTVLYVEDNPANLRLVTQLLGHRKNINLLTAHTAELGIDLAETRKPDLILLDINIPGMDGYQMLKAIKNSKTLQDIPVIAVTANAMPEDIKKGKAAGFNEYITKPIQIDRFLSVIDSALKVK